MTQLRLPTTESELPPVAEGKDPLERVLEALSSSRSARTLGLEGAARGYLLGRLSRRLKAQLVCVASDEDEADHLAADLSFFLGGAGTKLEPRVLRLPADEALPYDELSPDAGVVGDRLGALFHLRQGTRCTALVLGMRALLRKVLPPAVMNELSELVGVGQEHGRDNLARKLAGMGYLSSPLVEDPGTFSVRGDIIDVFPPLYDRPVRMELFGDTIESIRLFDPETQRTVETLKELYLLPARELFFNERTRPAAEAAARAAAERVNIPSSKVRERIEQIREGIPSFGMEALLPGFFGGLGTVLDYLPFWAEQPVIYLDDPIGIDRAAAELTEEVRRSFELAEERGELGLPPGEHFVEAAWLRERLRSFRTIEGGGLALGADEATRPVQLSFGSTRELREAILSHHGEEGALSPLVDRLSSWRELGIAAAVACGSMGQADRLKRLLLDRQLMVRVHPGPLDFGPKPAPGAKLTEPQAVYDPAVHAHLFAGEVSRGFVDPAGGFAVASDEEIFGARARRRITRRKAEAPFVASFRELKEGDLVVHTDFGIARYAGLTKMQVRGVPGDFLALEYAGKDKVYLPVSRMRLIQKFTGGDPTKVALDKLGSGSWERTKKRVKENLLKMAAELLKLYAARKAHPGHAFSQPDRYFRQFEADFEFEETPDQERAIDEVLSDMQKPEPMDRLVCGDVGYGKTEVAMRAAFKAVLDKKQVAVLVPTTVLAQQHFHTFRKRFADYPVTVEVVSRMRKADEVRETLKRATEGRLDVLIGTHRLLSGDISFKELGLLVVDEEQRFGVKHKEKLKRLRTQVDVLTLTATPIPRTLNMSMSGLRDMSIIATPPQDRRAIRTFVIKFDPAQIRDAIVREVHRGGQIFFVHNRVSSIRSMERFLHELVPEVTIGVAHGQMPEGQLEKVMVDFVERRYQLLLCTAIIESGIDIPSANTMIVNRADAFGLAQLYQLRGRVGRSRERAYAYLLVPARRAITREAQRRLEVLQAFSELGAGFTIASHDLEIRGAGNLLGPEQSGSIEAIGFDLYAQLLEEAVCEARGEPPRSEVEPEVNLPLAAFIPDDYVPDVHQRLVLYKRFSVAASPDELADLRAELVDRFGDCPGEVDNLSELTLLKIDMRELRLRALESGPARLVITLGPEPMLEPAKLAALIQRSKGLYRLTPDMKLVVRAPEGIQGVQLVAEAQKVIRDLEPCRTAESR
ncbi:MAG: transcription-repair coupling factor [Myxococcales bacterium]|nr:transcription-repair coupling factor [Myxococcales bacterium]